MSKEDEKARHTIAMLNAYYGLESSTENEICDILATFPSRKLSEEEIKKVRSWAKSSKE